jgi:hypothetical protein
MVRHGFVRHSAAPLLGALVLLCLAFVNARAADGECVVTVDPQAAAGGSVFTFSGSGFQPAQLALQKDEDTPIVSDVDVGGADPWTVTVQSRAGDEGAWKATFDVPDGCSVTVQFRVTLTDTDLAADLLGMQPARTLPALFFIVMGACGVGGGLFLARRLAAAQSKVRH